MQLAGSSPSIGSPLLWLASIAVLVALLVVDFIVTRRPHEVSFREAVGWSVFYLALPLLFGVLLWGVFGTGQAVEFITGFVVEKSLSVDNLFVFMLLLSGFAVPSQLQQRVLLYGIVGALVLRGIFIAAGAALLQAGTWAFLVFGAILFVTAVRILQEALRGHEFAAYLKDEVLDEILAEMKMVAEGVATTRAAYALAAREGVEMPILAEVHAVLFEGRNPRDAVANLMMREPKAELWR